MSRNPKVGLLLLYLKLYDEAMPDLRNKFDNFISQVTNNIKNHNIDVILSPICRINSEFQSAIQSFEQQRVDVIITLHLAYSPSLESCNGLCRTKLPIVMLDTTMDLEFGSGVAPERIMHNHGIHGVQDLASMLRRNKKSFEIVAGHLSNPAILKKLVMASRAAYASTCLRTTKALRLGHTFPGMGDFQVPDEIMQERLGIKVEETPVSCLSEYVNSIQEDEIMDECRSDQTRFQYDVSDEVHRRSVKVGLGLRRLLEQESYSAFSMNFACFDTPDGIVNTVPFLEASKAMERGIGYAGEGDVLTAALTGALQKGFGKTTFTEMFCPDWKGSSIFLSHMGEVNPQTADGQPRLIEMNFPWAPAKNPAIITCALQAGPAVLVNLVPGPNDSFQLIYSQVEMLAEGNQSSLQNSIRGWMQPHCRIEPFLEQYSKFGGTHHCALVYGDRIDGIRSMASFAGIEAVQI
jgi:L-arabinose isomerase